MSPQLVTAGFFIVQNETYCCDKRIMNVLKHQAMGILKISAKCSDLCWTEFTDSKGKKTNSDSYVPEGIGLSEDGDCGDYVSMEIDMKTGQILNWKPVSDAKVIAAQKKV
jgi:hypothetical protein